MNKTVKYILITVAILAALALIIWVIIYIANQRAATQPPIVNPAPGSGTSSTIVDALAGLFNGDFFSNLFGGNKCDPDRPGYTKNGKRDTRCDANTYNPYISTCDPNKCDPARPGYDQCGGFKMGC